MRICDMCGHAKRRDEATEVSFYAEAGGDCSFDDAYDICDTCIVKVRRLVCNAITTVRDVELISAVPSLTPDQRDRVHAWHATTNAKNGGA